MARGWHKHEIVRTGRKGGVDGDLVLAVRARPSSTLEGVIAVVHLDDHVRNRGFARILNAILVAVEPDESGYHRGGAVKVVRGVQEDRVPAVTTNDIPAVEAAWEGGDLQIAASDTRKGQAEELPLLVAGRIGVGHRPPVRAGYRVIDTGWDLAAAGGIQVIRRVARVGGLAEGARGIGERREVRRLGIVGIRTLVKVAVPEVEGSGRSGIVQAEVPRAGVLLSGAQRVGVHVAHQAIVAACEEEHRAAGADLEVVLGIRRGGAPKVLPRHLEVVVAPTRWVLRRRRVGYGLGEPGRIRHRRGRPLGDDTAAVRSIAIGVGI